MTVMIKTIRRMRHTRSTGENTTAKLNWSGRAEPAPAVVKYHGDKLGEAFK
jgi:hypothetical protein